MRLLKDFCWVWIKIYFSFCGAPQESYLPVVRIETLHTIHNVQADYTGRSKSSNVTDSGEGVCVDPGEKGAILEAGGPGPPGGGKGRLAVGFRQWRRKDIARWPETQETGSPHLQETFMHRVSSIVHCITVIQYNHNRNRISLYYLFQENKSPITICIHPLMYGKLCRAQVIWVLYIAGHRHPEN